MIVRELLTRLSFSADESKVRSFDAAVVGLQRTLVAVVGAATAATAAAFSLAQASARYGDEVAKTARQLGIGGEALQEYRFAFDRLGVSEGETTAGLERFSRALGRAAQGSGTEADAFERLGISIRGSDGRLRDMADLLPEAADGLAAIENEAERAAMAQDLFGRSGGRLAMALAAGGAEISDLREEFRLLGGGLSQDQLDAAEDFTDAMTNLRTVLNGLRLQIGAELMPVFQPMIEAITQFIAINREIILTRAHDFFRMLSDAMGNLMAVAERVIDVITRVWSAVDNLSGFEKAALAVGLLLLAWRRLGKFFLAAALVAILDDIGAWMANQPSLIGKLLGPYEDFAESVQSVVDALGGMENVIRIIVGLALARWLLKVAGAARAAAIALGFGGAAAAAGASGAAAGSAWRMAFLASAAAGLARGLVRRIPVIGAASFGLFGGINPADQTPQALIDDQLAASGLEEGSPEWQMRREELIRGLGPITADNMDVFETEIPARHLHRRQHPDIDASNLLGGDIGDLLPPPPAPGSAPEPAEAPAAPAAPDAPAPVVTINTEAEADALSRALDRLGGELGTPEAPEAPAAPFAPQAPEAPEAPEAFGGVAEEIRAYLRALEIDPSSPDIPNIAADIDRAAAAISDEIRALEMQPDITVDAPDIAAPGVTVEQLLSIPELRVTVDRDGGEDTGASRAIRELQDYLGSIEEMSFDLNAPPELETLSGDIDNSVTNTALDFNVTQNITVPPGTTAEQLAVIRAEARRTLEREINSAARALET